MNLIGIENRLNFLNYYFCYYQGKAGLFSAQYMQAFHRCSLPVVCEFVGLLVSLPVLGRVSDFLLLQNSIKFRFR